jgi:hypothetical protein
VITYLTLDPSVHGVGLPIVEGVEGVAVPVNMGDDSPYEDDSSTTDLVCKKKSCKSGTAVSKCKVKRCTKSTCVSCFNGMLKQHKLEPLRDPINGEIIMCCSKTHYQIALKQQKAQKPVATSETPTAAAPASRPTDLPVAVSKATKKKANTELTDNNKLAWNRDGPKGPSDPINSESILMKWLLEEGNFNKYCECKGGMTKKKFAEQIVILIKEAGILSKRDDKQVRNKIEYLQKQFRATLDWSTKATGQGIKDGNPLNWENTLRSKFHLYFDLLPIMGTRASASPIIDSEKGLDTTDNKDDNNSDEDDTTISNNNDGNRKKNKKTNKHRRVIMDSSDEEKPAAKHVLTVGDIICYKVPDGSDGKFVYTVDMVDHIIQPTDFEDVSSSRLMLRDDGTIENDTLVSQMTTLRQRHSPLFVSLYRLNV